MWTIIVIDVFYGTICAPNFNFFLHMLRIPAMTFVFLLRKRKEIVKVTLIGSFNDFLFRETATAPAQGVAASNSVEEGSSSFLETYCHPS